MTIRLYKRDPYMSEFEATITQVDGDCIILDASAFYPGGGGQGNDIGSINGFNVTVVKAAGEEVVHTVPGHRMATGSKVWCSVDWDRRYDLMRAHTAEHMLFSALKAHSPELELMKISIEPENKHLIVRGDVDWAMIAEVQVEVNGLIAENLSVIRTVMHKDDPDIGDVRVKLDRIEGDEVSVVEIDDDKVACTGIHVMETGEVGALLVTRLASAGGGDTVIEFETGEAAMERALDLAIKAMEASEAIGGQADDLVKTARNLKERSESLRKALRAGFKGSVDGIEPMDIGGMSVVTGVFPCAERGDLTDAAERIRSSGKVALLMSVDGSLSVVMGSPSGSGIDCKVILGEALGSLGGRGGGRPEFAQGGCPDPSASGELLDRVLDLIRDARART